MSEDILSGLENLNLDEPDNTRKLFIGGLSWMTTEDGLRQYFENLGLHVDTVVIMRDKNGKSRGFGFLTLGSLQEIEIAISISLFLDGRKVEAKRAIPKSDLSNHAKKIFVGGIPMSLTNTDFRKYFESFGKVLETQIMTDRESGRSRGFGFVTFEEENVAAVVLRMSHTIQSKPVEVKPAEPKNNSTQTLPNTPLSSMYLPSYSSAFNSTFNFEQANYLNQRQGRVVYLPHVYESLSTADSQNYNFLSESLIKRSNTAPVMQRPTVPNTSPFKLQPFYERPETLSNQQNNLYPLNPVIGTGLELRTERAFSAPCTDTSFLPDDLLGRIGKLSPPIKRRNANTNSNNSSNNNGPTPAISIPASTLFSNTSSTLFSNPPTGLLRTDPTNWFKSTSITSTEPNVSLHKYFQ